MLSKCINSNVQGGKVYSTVPIDGVNTFDPQWLIPVFPDQPKLVLNGTIQQVQRTARALNPDWDDYIGNLTEAAAEGEEEEEEEEEDVVVESLHRRSRRCSHNCAKFAVKSLNCDDNPQNWRRAFVNDIIAGIDHLRGQQGIPYSTPGPKTCGRVSCSWKSAIWWCNDATTEKFLSSFTDIANGAYYIINSCPKVRDSSQGAYVWGQVFHVDNWNVIVREDRQDC
ncbi:hypothetical protein CP533_0725 [Ophiocordyceps camponoti-saundersi (nom. inval.)]|nr:hypothetical protein CP533_0725 [Ophiocordyceps camponoti-saundersi (nom. inval.)]